MDEVWKSVPSLPGVQASSLGRLLFPPRNALMPKGGAREYTPKPTCGYKRKSQKNATHTYMGVYYKHFGNIKVHQAICEAFYGPKPSKESVVIHLDEDATNNKPDNLKWGSQKENLNMAKIKEYHRTSASKKFGREV